jgi:hypothetical protein
MEGGTKMKYAGADWLIKSYPDLKPSPLGVKVADMLGMVWSGLYHLDPRIIKKTNWADPYCISVLIQQSLATADWQDLTELVILCHDFAVRMDLAPHMRYLRLFFHQRTREGHYNQRHPTIEEAVLKCRERWNEK